jgi:hypothetical protein
MTRSLTEIRARHAEDCAESFPDDERTRWRIACADRIQLLALVDESLALLKEAAITLDRCRYSEQPMAKKCFAFLKLHEQGSWAR